MVMFIVINLFIIVLIVLLLIVLSWIWPPDSPWAPWWKTSKEKALAVCKLANIKSSDIVYELGSGNATFLMVAAKESGAKCIGIEIDPLRVITSKIAIRRNGLNNNIKIKRGNMFSFSYPEASVIFVYLVPKALKKLLPKFKKKLKKGTRVVSLNYEIDLPLKKFDKKNNLRLYVV